MRVNNLPKVVTSGVLLKMEVGIRGVHGNGEDWDPMGPMRFPWEWE